MDFKLVYYIFVLLNVPTTVCIFIYFFVAFVYFSMQDFFTALFI